MRTPGELALIASIADDLPAGIWVAEAPSGAFVYANRAFEEIMGMGAVADVARGEYAQPYGIYTRGGELYPEGRMPFVRALEARALVVVDDLAIHRRDGGRVFVRAHAKPLFDANGAITHVAIAFFDITAEVTAQTQLAHAERLASLGMLAAGVAHEVNNPLAYVLGSLEALAREMDAGSIDLRTARALVRDAREGADRVRAIVRDLKTFSRAGDRRPSRLDVRGPIEAAIAMARNEVRHRARLEVDLAPVPAVAADEGRVAQLFLNLLINAAQAIEPGAADRNVIRVVTRKDADGCALAEVSDSGAGIAEPARARIFEPFFTTKAEGVGTGLGLSVCHAIVSDLGGSIAVESAPGRGSTFRVRLPPAPIEAPPPRADSLRADPGGKRGRVLVIDDEAPIGRVVKLLLGAEHDVTFETRADAAIERVRGGERFDVILCDLMMPEASGMEVHERLSAIVPEQAGAIVFVTGGAFTEPARAFLANVSNAVLEKPFDTRELARLVRSRVG